MNEEPDVKLIIGKKKMSKNQINLIVLATRENVANCRVLETD